MRNSTSFIISDIKSFLVRHGHSASAVIEPTGRVGVRIVLIGADGILGDQIVPSTQIAQEILSTFPTITISSWTQTSPRNQTGSSQTLSNMATPRKGHHRAMGRR